MVKRNLSRDCFEVLLFFAARLPSPEEEKRNIQLESTGKRFLRGSCTEEYVS
jgi:hypothetical protein